MDFSYELQDDFSSEYSANESLNELIEQIRSYQRFNFLSEKCRDIILIFSYSLIILISFVGNVLVCKVILPGPLLTNTDKLIVNLSISDLLMTVLNIPFNIVRFVLDNWPFGKALCILVPFSQSVSVHCSSITMMFIAIERYRNVFNLTNRKCLSITKILFIIWLSSCVLSVPHGIFMRVVDKKSHNESKTIVRCQVIYPEPYDVFRQRLTVFTFLSQYIVPILLTCACYIRISVFLWGRKIVGSVPQERRASIFRSNISRIKTLLIVVLVFAICWLPLNVYHLLTDYDLIIYSSELYFTSHWLAMSSVCYNPFIYCWMNESFKTKIINLFRWRSLSRNRSHETNDDNRSQGIQIDCIRHNSGHQNDINVSFDV